MVASYVMKLAKQKRNASCSCGSGTKFKKCCGSRLPIARKCGGCTACCTVMEISSLNKPAGEHCKHQCPTGCGIYSDRPSACQTYQCEWIKGKLRPEDRPDLIGLVVDTGGPAFRMTWGDDAVNVREVTTKSSENGRASELIDEFVSSGASVFVKAYRGNSRFLCSTEYGEKKFMKKLKLLKKRWNLVEDWKDTSEGYEAKAATGEHIEFIQSDKAWLLRVDGEFQ